MRRLIRFPCEGVMLVATLDEAAGQTGLLIVSGGNEIRIGAHRGMAKLAADIAMAGHPVFRFDRRGIGDSEGENGGFETSGPDIVAALAAFRTECPGLTRFVAFGNCDAATALRLHVHSADAIILANPWLVEATSDAPPPATARAYYAQRLRDPKAWAGLFKGAVNLGKLFGSLRSAAKRDAASSLAHRFAERVTGFPIETRILLAARDGTAIAFKAQWDGPLFDHCRDAIPLILLDSASHSFAGDDDYAVLKAELLAVLSLKTA
jgi:exosortase A-associated hydrolase 1